MELRTLLALTASLGAGTLLAQSDKPAPKVPTGIVAGQAIGRSLVSPDGTVEVFGYFSSIDGLGNRIFSGAPSEGTAHFTFRSVKARLVSIPNGGVFQFRLEPIAEGDAFYTIYYNPNPNQNFARPDTFSDGQVIATYRVRGGTLTLVPGVMLAYTASYEALGSTEITFRDAKVDLAKIADSITVNVTGPGVASVDLSQGLSIPFSGHVVAAGK